MPTASKPSPRTDIYTRVTDSIVTALEAGTRPWSRPWNSGGSPVETPLPLRHNGIPYRGVNVLLLWMQAVARGYAAPVWMTYKQAQSLGAQVRKGETGSFIVYANRLTTTETNDQGEDVEREIAFMKGYTVFNAEQIDGLPEQYRPAPTVPSPMLERIAEAERFFTATGANVRHGGSRAYYVPSADFIQLPPPESFRDAESYAATKAHELVHWTGNEARLARTFGERFGDEAYAVEELVAELGAAFLCATLGIAAEPRADHTAYLAHWLSVLKADKRAIFTAAAQAQRAADFLHAMQQPLVDEPEPALTEN
jgi:antirestriction protein ArdC